MRSVTLPAPASDEKNSGITRKFSSNPVRTRRRQSAVATNSMTGTRSRTRPIFAFMKLPFLLLVPATCSISGAARGVQQPQLSFLKTIAEHQHHQSSTGSPSSEQATTQGVTGGPPQVEVRGTGEDPTEEILRQPKISRPVTLNTTVVDRGAGIAEFLDFASREEDAPSNASLVLSPGATSGGSPYAETVAPTSSSKSTTPSASSPARGSKKLRSVTSLLVKAKEGLEGRDVQVHRSAGAVQDVVYCGDETINAAFLRPLDARQRASPFYLQKQEHEKLQQPQIMKDGHQRASGQDAISNVADDGAFSSSSSCSSSSAAPCFSWQLASSPAPSLRTSSPATSRSGSAQTSPALTAAVRSEKQDVLDQEEMEMEAQAQGHAGYRLDAPAEPDADPIGDQFKALDVAYKHLLQDDRWVNAGELLERQYRPDARTDSIVGTTFLEDLLNTLKQCDTLLAEEEQERQLSLLGDDAGALQMHRERVEKLLLYALELHHFRAGFGIMEPISTSSCEGTESTRTAGGRGAGTVGTSSGGAAVTSSAASKPDAEGSRPPPVVQQQQGSSSTDEESLSQSQRSASTSKSHLVFRSSNPASARVASLLTEYFVNLEREFDGLRRRLSNEVLDDEELTAEEKVEQQQFVAQEVLQPKLPAHQHRRLVLGRVLFRDLVEHARRRLDSAPVFAELLRDRQVMCEEFYARVDLPLLCIARRGLQLPCDLCELDEGRRWTAEQIDKEWKQLHERALLRRHDCNQVYVRQVLEKRKVEFLQANILQQMIMRKLEIIKQQQAHTMKDECSPARAGEYSGNETESHDSCMVSSLWNMMPSREFGRELLGMLCLGGTAVESDLGGKRSQHRDLCLEQDVDTGSFTNAEMNHVAAGSSRGRDEAKNCDEDQEQMQIDEEESDRFPVFSSWEHFCDARARSPDPMSPLTLSQMIDGRDTPKAGPLDEALLYLTRVVRAGQKAAGRHSSSEKDGETVGEQAGGCDESIGIAAVLDGLRCLQINT
ncbi:unnamed protein product [Amoebophrya sp. A120]|nr:unnamed protein product [Amoebophrya sp. A120]|eukprot:GSA120T00004344001.1